MITDEQKIDLQQQISYLIEASQTDPGLRHLSHLDAGSHYGRRRAVGQGHQDAVTSVQYLCTQWFNLKPFFCDVPPPAPVLELSGDEIVALHDAVMERLQGQRPDSSLAMECVDLGSEYGSARQQGQSAEEARAMAVRTVCGWYGLPLPVPPVVGLQGRLQVDRLGFRDAAGPVLPLFCHFGEAFSAFTRRPAEVRDELARIKAAGYHGIRFWDVLGFWDMAWRGREVSPVPFTAHSGAGVRATPNYYGQLADFLRLCQDLQLKVHHSRGDMNSWTTPMIEQHLLQVAQVQQAVGLDVVAINEVCNEAWQNGVPSPDELKRLAGLLPRGTIRATSAANDDYGGEVPSSFDQFALDVHIVHGYRGGDTHNRIGHIMAVGYETVPEKKVPVWQGEPAGPGSGVTVGQENHVEGLCLMAMMALSTHQGWVYMSSHGVFWNGSLSTMPGFAEVPKACAVIPADIQNGWDIFHGGERWRDKRIFEANADGTLRCDHMVRGAQFQALIYGTPKAWTIPVRRSFTGEIIRPVTLERIPVTMRAGELLNVTFERGVLIQGTLV